MSDIKNDWLQHIETLEKNIPLKPFTSHTLSEWTVPLLRFITEDGAIPYLLNTNERYRASPLASAISWMEKANLLPISVLTRMQEELLFLRDENVPNDPDFGNTIKKAGDEDGWSVGEGVSVWSTSCAIEALLDSSGNGVAHAQKFKSSVMWLRAQQNLDKGWAYQKSANCESNIIMTSLALRSLAMAYAEDNRDAFHFSAAEIDDLERAFRDGFEYLKASLKRRKRKVWWTFKDEPHCAATTWALLALYWLSKCNSSISSDAKAFYRQYKKAALSFVVSRIPSGVAKWPEEAFVYEGGAKYDKQKNYASFSATLLLQLFKLGLSPFHPKVINQIKWLINNPNEWKITIYNREEVCYFTYAMTLATIVRWAQQVGSTFAPVLIRTDKYKLSSLLYGYNFSTHLQVQLIRPSRITCVATLCIFLTLSLLLGEQINTLADLISMRLISLWSTTGEDRYNLLISLISDFIKFIIQSIFVVLLPFVIRFLRRSSDD